MFTSNINMLITNYLRLKLLFHKSDFNCTAINYSVTYVTAFILKWYPTIIIELYDSIKLS